MRVWVVAALAACNGDKTGTESGATGDTSTTIDTQTVSTPDQRIAAIVGLVGDTAAGTDTYGSQCIGCHGYDGSGIASDAADLNAALPKLTDEQVATTILLGQGNMDAYDFLSNQQIADVIAYIRSAFGGATTP
ncbi:MAG: cytochrome c [Myxococcota bacterium]